MIDLRKNKTDEVTAEQVLDIIRNTRGFHINIECFGQEPLHPDDRYDILLSADYFRSAITLAEIEEEGSLWENEPDPVKAASNVLDYFADHGIYNTLSINLIPAI
jgi:hypothetical protein